MVLSHQPPRHYIPVVPQPAKGNPPSRLQPVQVAGHQNCVGADASCHCGPVPLQYAWLYGQETPGGLRAENTIFNQSLISSTYYIMFEMHELNMICMSAFGKIKTSVDSKPNIRSYVFHWLIFCVHCFKLARAQRVKFN